jgi:Domain of unknown function (DUF4149)
MVAPLSERRNPARRRRCGPEEVKSMARSQLVSLAVLGAWIAATLFMWFAATSSFRTVDAVLAKPNPAFQEATKPLGESETRTVLRHLSSEINRTLFRGYGWTQLALAGLFLFLMWRRTPSDSTARVLAAVMLGLVLILTFYIQPQIIVLGRSLDFVPRHPPPPEMSRFWMYHGAFTALDGVKLLVAAFLLVRLILRRA